MKWLVRFLLWLTPTDTLLNEVYRRYGTRQD